MLYYHIWVRSTQYHGKEALTYGSTAHIPIGSLVIVPLRKERVLGIVVGEVTKPLFTTKPIEVVLSLPALPTTSLKLVAWIQQFYPSPLGVAASLLVPANLATGRLPHTSDEPVLTSETVTEPELTLEQRNALTLANRPDTYLLHGRTGSGKTRIYTELARRILSQGRSVMVLTPEIGLTSQLAASFEKLFGEQVLTFHSRLTNKERQHIWLRILRAQSPLIVVGPRSALFSPLNNIGLIIVDESHDQAYKQEQSPHYQGLRVAAQLRRLHNALLILGSATPTVAEYYLAVQKNKTIIKLEQLAMPQVHEKTTTVVDIKDRSQFTRSAHLSLPLLRAISESLNRGEQSLLYLNRRGTARVALCQVCGWQAMCPNCDIPLIYHGDSHILRCHICGHARPVLTSCPECHNPALTFRSFGTKAIVDEVEHLFPEARTLRFDADNLKADRLESHYQSIRQGSADIIIGTQMIAKGLDLPSLSTLGIILADSSLYVPDYTAHERTYQLLTQVVGRIGRGHVRSHAIVQTYHPHSELLKAALHNDWENFYTSEISERKKYSFPPFCHLLKLTCARASSAGAEKAAQGYCDQLRSHHLPIIIEGPAPAFHEKNGGKYHWQIIIKSRERSALLSVASRLPPSGWSYDLDPANLL